MAYPAKFTRTKNKGMTITELLVASIMIGIVMLGVISFGLAIKNLQRSTNKTVFVALRTKAAMAQITNDASLAVGHELDRGVLGYNAGATSICFRHDDPVTPTPEDYTDDDWICYFQRAGVNRPLESCGIIPFGSGSVPPNNSNDCDDGDVRQALLNLENGTPDFSEIVENGDGRFLYVNITLTTLFDTSPGSTFHAIDNPRYTTSTQISPLGHSR